MTTTLRFVGDLPVWIGLILALAVGVLSWRYYRRESFELNGSLKWILPMLRTSAFVLGVLILLGPVLHHRRVIGNLGRVKIYADESQSMTQHDRQMTFRRKLKIAHQFGWLDEEELEAHHFDAFDRLAELHSQRQVTQPQELLQEIVDLRGSLPISIEELLTTQLVEPFKDVSSGFTEEQQESFSKTVDRVFKQYERDILSEVSSSPRWTEAVGRFDVTSRWQRVLEMLSPEFVSELSGYHDVEIYSLEGEEAHLFDSESDAGEDTFSVFTDLITGVLSSQKEVIDAGEEHPSTIKNVVVMLTDGHHNSGPSPVQTARVLGNQNTPVYCIAVGAERPATDLAVLAVEYPDIVFQKDTVHGVMSVRDRVPAGTPFVAQVRYDNEVLWQKECVSTNATEQRIEFEVEIDALIDQLKSHSRSEVVQHAIPLDLEASVSVLPEESESGNNACTMRLAAITERKKVLLLDGRARWETRYVRNVFERDEQWDIDTIIAGPGTSKETLPRGDERGAFPISRDDLFAYDLIIWGEIDLELFEQSEREWLRDYVETRGGGWIFIDGNRGKFAPLVDSELGPLLPVDWSDMPAEHVQTLRLTDIGRQLPALRLAADEEQNQNLWLELPAPRTPASVVALSGTQVLAECVVNTTHVPYMVSRQCGAGRVLYLASDETWRWRYKNADVWHQRFWNQLAKYVMPPPFTVSDEYVSIDTGPVSYEFGEAVNVRIRLFGLDGQPAEQAIVDALVWKDDRVVGQISLTSDENLPGIYRGQLGRLPHGSYEVSVQAAGFSASSLKARTEFSVLPIETSEMTQTAVNHELLHQMATASGGMYLPEEDFGNLCALLEPFSDGRIVESDTLIWQSYWWFGAIVLLLTLEWLLRKRVGLL